MAYFQFLVRQNGQTPRYGIEKPRGNERNANDCGFDSLSFCCLSPSLPVSRAIGAEPLPTITTVRPRRKNPRT